MKHALVALLLAVSLAGCASDDGESGDDRGGAAAAASGRGTVTCEGAATPDGAGLPAGFPELEGITWVMAEDKGPTRVVDGYAILQRVRESSGGRIEWTDGMLYPVLHRLERLGYVRARWEVAESGRRRKYYRITSRGRAQLAEERRQWQAVDATLRGIWQALSLSVPASAPASAAPLPQSA